MDTCRLCGNGIRETNEICDDGNLKDGDGCSNSCEVEDYYTCTAQIGKSSECQALCGDGYLFLNETCDDGNLEDGDGCAADCTTVESNYYCYPVYT